MTFPHGLERLPPDLVGHVETALVDSEASFRETLTRIPRSWIRIRSAIEAAMSAVLVAFHRQALLAVQQRVLSVSDARSAADECLDGHAHSIYDWLLPFMNRPLADSPYSFRRYNSVDTFVFSRDMLESVHASEAWRVFLRDLSKPMSPDPPPKDATALAWRDVTIRFISDHKVQATVRGEIQAPLNYTEMGFEDRRDGRPRAAWDTFRSLAESEGIIASAHATEWSKVEKRIQEIRERLRQHFGIATDPIPYDDGAYRAQFRLERSPSYDA